jgi:hypothetical protein
MGAKDQAPWVKACMTDKAKEAACAINAASLDAVDACNGSAAKAAWTIRVGVGECAAMMGHTMDIAISARLEGGVVDPGTRSDILNNVERSLTAEDMKACSLLGHADVQCFLSAGDPQELESCGQTLAKNNPAFVGQLMSLANGNAPKSTTGSEHGSAPTGMTTSSSHH